MLAHANPAEPARLMAILAARGTKLLFLYSAQDAGLDEISRHFGSPARLAAIPGASLQTVPDADHNFSPAWARARLLQAAAAHFAASFAAPPFDASLHRS